LISSVPGAIGAGHFERERAACQRDDFSTRVARELQQQDAEEAEADDRDGLSCTDVAAAEDVHRARERFGWKRQAPQGFWQSYDAVRRRDVVFGIGVSRQHRDAIAHGMVADVLADCDDFTPAFVAGCARRERIGEPWSTGPDGKIRRTDAATFEAHAKLAWLRARHRRGAELDARIAAEDGRLHRAHAACVPASAHCVRPRSLPSHW
jgi:hypothetical protein